MSTMTKRRAAGTLALAVCIGGGSLALSGSANAEGLAPRMTAASTADLLSERPLVVVTGSAPWDALAAGPFAGIAGAPILLNSPGKDLEPAIAQYLDAAKAEDDPITNVYVIGGPSAVSYDVEEALSSRGAYVDRIWGADRYATARNVADAIDHLLYQ